MRTYELVLIFDPALEMEQIESDLQKLNDLITANGLPRRWERWGKRRLAYEIKGRQYGYYAVAVFDTTSDQIREIERLTRLYTSVIRSLATIVDPERIPEVDEESVRTLGAGATPPEADTAKPAEEPDAAAEATPEIVPEVVEGETGLFTEPRS